MPINWLCKNRKEKVTAQQPDVLPPLKKNESGKFIIEKCRVVQQRFGVTRTGPNGFQNVD